SALARAIGELREEGAELVVLLSSAGRREARRLGHALDVDFVIEGGVDEAEARPPSAADDAYLIHAGRHGQGFVVLDVVLDGSGPFRDASAWTRAEAAAQLEARVAELEAHIEAWEPGPDSRARAPAKQRARSPAPR